MSKIKKATPEDIQKYLEGHDEQKYITSIELDQTDDWSVDDSNKVYMMIDDPKKGKSIKVQKFVPFLWTKNLRGSGFYNDDIDLMRTMAKRYGIYTEKLETGDDPRLNDGFKFIVKTSGTYRDLVGFFSKGGLNPWKHRDKIQMLPPVEQFLIQTGKRLFKGFEDYNEVHKVTFDIETTSLDPKDGHIFLIGIKDNRGYHKIVDSYENGVWTENGERRMLTEFFEILHELDPSIMIGYNSEAFDWHYVLGRMSLLGMSTEKVSKNGTRTISSKVIKTKHPLVELKRKPATLKLGAELEEYDQTNYWGVNMMDTMHRVRQAMAINSNIKQYGLKYIAKESKVERPNRVYVPGDQLGTMWVENKDFLYNPTSGQWYSVGGLKPEPKMEENDNHEMVVIDGYEDKWEPVNGRFLITEYLVDDLLETEKVDDQYTQAAFLTAGLVPTGFLRSATMGTATLWKLLMMGWSYENNIALPDVLPKRNFVGGLSRLLKTGFSRNIVKLDYASLYPSIQLSHDVFPTCDVSGALEAMLQYLYDTRNKYKYLMNEAEEAGNPKEKTKYDRKQLPIKILNNSAFGSISAPYIFPWGDIDIGETITCTGRQYLRHMIRFFMDRGYQPLVLDTDGVNFSYDDIAHHRYTGRGLHRFVEKGKTYEGLDADVAEYNERFMHGVMGLDNDGEWPATINLSRKNYATLTPKGEVKLTGNSIKSKGTSIYIEKFLNKGIGMLLRGKGKEFVDYYHEYLEKIYNQQIPLVEIANKSRVKKTIRAYQNRGLNKNGGKLPRQAHMELLIKEGLEANLGDTIYYVNNGTRKSHGDIQLRKTKKDPPEGTLVFNSYLINKEEIENNPEATGEYNIARYIDAFNKKVTPLLVVFNKNVRDALLITNPEDKQYFTKTELELVSGIPMKEDHQDTLEELMTISEEELRFWADTGKDCEYMIKDRFEEEVV